MFDGKKGSFLYCLIFFATAFFILKTSTFGFRQFQLRSGNPMKEDVELVKVLKSHVFNLAEKIGDRSIFKYEKLEEAARYISEELESFGYEVQFQEYRVYDKKTKNIIVSKQGTLRPQEVIIVGAHYDTCFNPGADDNASAVAGLLELARFFLDKQTSRTIKFIAFVNEEPPFFKSENMGSRVYAREAKKKKENIKAVIILEMIGYYSNKVNSQKYPPLMGLFYPNRANFLCVVGNWNSRRLVKEFVLSFKRNTQFPIESFVGPGIVAGVDFSDHWSFWKEGYPAVMVTDTAFYRYPHYHRESDTDEKLDYESMAEVINGLKCVLVELVK